jgi:hypothetical protein
VPVPVAAASVPPPPPAATSWWQRLCCSCCCRPQQPSAPPVPRAAPPSDHVILDPITDACIMPPAVYRAAGAGWLLDHFSRDTLRQVLAHRVWVRSQPGGQGERGVDGHARRPGAELLAPPVDGSDSKTPDGERGAGGDATAAAPPAAAPPTLASRAPIPASISPVWPWGGCVSPRWFVPLAAQQIAATVAWSALACVALWLIVVGAVAEGGETASAPASHVGQAYAWGGMLLLGVSGLAALYTGLRIRPAGRLALVGDAEVQRYLALQ